MIDIPITIFFKKELNKEPLQITHSVEDEFNKRTICINLNNKYKGMLENNSISDLVGKLKGM